MLRVHVGTDRFINSRHHFCCSISTAIHDGMLTVRHGELQLDSSVPNGVSMTVFVCGKSKFEEACCNFLAWRTFDALALFRHVSIM